MSNDTVSYEVVTRADINDDWTNDVGDANEFDSIEDALDGIEQLRALGEEWRAAQYAVRVRGDQYICAQPNEAA